MRRILILGTSDFAIETACLAAEIADVEVAGFVENLDRNRCRKPLDGLPVHWIDDIAGMADSHHVVCGLGTTKRHVFVAQAERLGMNFATLVHPAAHVSARCAVGSGTVVNAGTVIAAHAEIGSHVCINRGALIGHHTRIGAFATIGPGSNIAGSCHIGERVYIGMGALVCDKRRIGAGTLVSAGALVAKDLPGRVQVAGAPARIIKRDFDGL